VTSNSRQICAFEASFAFGFRSRAGEGERGRVAPTQGDSQMIKTTSFGFAIAVGAGLWGAACSSSSSPGVTPDDAGAEDAASDTSVADSAPQDAAADTSPAADSAATNDGGDAGPPCADGTSSACTACHDTAATTGACMSQYTTCKNDTSGSDNGDAGSNLSCSGILACVAAGGSTTTCGLEGTSTGISDAEALASCEEMACPSN
jgi:hypothetical protein